MPNVDGIRERLSGIVLRCASEEKLRMVSDAAPETVRLLGQDAATDSIGLVRYLVAVEDRVNREFGTSIALMDERAMSQSKSPFRTLATLTDFLTGLVLEAGGGKAV
jgi:hypothetical protein